MARLSYILRHIAEVSSIASGEKGRQPHHLGGKLEAAWYRGVLVLVMALHSMGVGFERKSS